jgi:dipeptidyl aminopeptidase/acylaminoacyl peptidase
MKKILFFVMIFSTKTLFCQTQPEPLSVDKIMRDPKWIGTSPNHVFWSYDSKAVYFKWNPDHALSDSDYIYILNSKEPVKVSYNEALRSREISEGIYNKARTKIAYIYKADVYLLDLGSGKTTRITQTESEESHACFSKNDGWVVYQSKNNLFAWDIASGGTEQISSFAEGKSPLEKKLNDQEIWLKQEQLQTSAILKQRADKKISGDNFMRRLKEPDSLVKIYTGTSEVTDLNIGPDGRFISYNLVEKPKDAMAGIVPNYVTESGFPATIPARSKVGVPQEKYDFFVFDRRAGKIIEINPGELPGIAGKPGYLKDYPPKNADTGSTKKRVHAQSISWNDDGSACILDIRSQDNKDRWLAQLNPLTGDLTTLDHQHDEGWIAGPGIGWISETTLGFVNNSEYYFQSEETGYSHLYIYNILTHTKKALTRGNYEVRRVQISNDKKYFYFIANEEHPGIQHLYRIKSDGTAKEKLTSARGGYEFSLSPDEKNISWRYSYQNRPWELFVLQNSAGKNPLQVTHNAMSPEFKSYPWRDTKIFSFSARDGKPVYSRLYQPMNGKKNNAAVIFVHGAGYLQNVDYGWSYYYHEMMFNNLLADKGFTVMDIDYRASEGYGRDWRTGIYRWMGGKDLDDEVDAARFLVKEMGIDSSRIGLYGGSYGGFLTLMALFTQPDVFKAGAALRPVTDWAHYEHEYSSAILNEPFTDSISYQRSSPINFAKGLKNHLLICHGMVDVNVHFQDAVRLTQKLIELGKDNWELAVYPVEDHGFVEPSSWTDEYKRVLKLFETYLK